MSATTETEAQAYVMSNATDGAMWHVAVPHEMRTAVTNTLMKTYWHTRCSGRGLGGAYGSTMKRMATPPSNLCPRCAAIMAKETKPMEKPITAKELADSYEAGTLDRVYLGEALQSLDRDGVISDAVRAKEGEQPMTMPELLEILAHELWAQGLTVPPKVARDARNSPDME